MLFSGRCAAATSNNTHLIRHVLRFLGRSTIPNTRGGIRTSFEQFIESGLAKFAMFSSGRSGRGGYAVVPTVEAQTALSAMCTTYCNTLICGMGEMTVTIDHCVLVLQAADLNTIEAVYSCRSRSSSAVNFEPLSALENRLYRVRRSAAVERIAAFRACARRGRRRVLAGHVRARRRISPAFWCWRAKAINVSNQVRRSHSVNRHRAAGWRATGRRCFGAQHDICRPARCATMRGRCFISMLGRTVAGNAKRAKRLGGCFQ